MTSGPIAMTRREARDAREKTPPRPGFRADVEGLRAVAIALVVVFHIWFGRVSGGVDVFLMVSGFFVAGGLLRRFGADQPPRLPAYFLRLLRRLLPSAAIVLAAVVLGTALILPMNRWAAVAEEVLASLVYSENWLLAVRGATYGAADDAVSPLQHFWSLSVQGQLFFGLPILLALVWLLARRVFAIRAARRVLIGVVGFATSASFAYAMWATAVDQPRAYYDTGARAWEYLVGALLAVALPHLRLPSVARVAAGWTGIAMIVATGFLLDGGLLFPGPATLLPIGGAALVIAAGSAPTRFGVDRALSWGPLSRAGAYAYGMYLWHWPLLIFFIHLATPSVGVGIGGGLLVIVLSVALTVATKHGIDRATSWFAASGGRPWFRHRSLPVVAALVATVVAVPTAFLVYRDVKASQMASVLAQADLDTYPGALASYAPEAWTTPSGVAPIPDLVAAPSDSPQLDGCVSWPDQTRLLVCSFGDLKSERSVLLVGGSHSEHWLPALEALGETNGFRVDTALKVGCPFTTQSHADDCDRWYRSAMSYALRSDYDYIVTTSTRPGDHPGSEVIPEGYVEAWERLQTRGRQVLAIRDTPWFEEAPLDCITDPGVPVDECIVDRSAVLADESPTVEADLPANVRTLDLTDVLCPNDGCPAVIGNRIVYRDSNHMTTTFASTLAPALGEQFGALTGWW